MTTSAITNPTRSALELNQSPFGDRLGTTRLSYGMAPIQCTINLSKQEKHHSMYIKKFG